MALSLKCLRKEIDLQDADLDNIGPHRSGKTFSPLRRSITLSALILQSIFGVQSVAAAQDSNPSKSQPGSEYTLTLNANMVLLSATVVDRHNALVSGLDKNDFNIFEDGVLQPVKYFSHEDIPVTAGILVDNSGSMGTKRSDVIASALAFAHSSNPQDQMFVVNFNDRVSFGLPKEMPFTDQPDKLRLALSSIRTIGETALYDGIAAALDHLKQGNRDKKVLILITDGGDNASKHKLTQVIEMAKQSSAIIYAIGIFDERDGEQNPGVLRRLAKETGGVAYFPDSSREILLICEDIARDIRNQYTLAYVPAIVQKAGSYRAIAVKASAPGRGHLSVRTRTGYAVTSDSPPTADKAIGHEPGN